MPSAAFPYASRPLRRIPAIVSFLNPQPALSLVGGNRSSCPEADPHKGSRDHLAVIPLLIDSHTGR